MRRLGNRQLVLMRFKEMGIMEACFYLKIIFKRWEMCNTQNLAFLLKLRKKMEFGKEKLGRTYKAEKLEE